MANKLVLVVLCFVSYSQTKEDWYSYDYSNDYSNAPANDHGLRLINAAKATANEFPFVAAMFIEQIGRKGARHPEPKCTCSLVSSRYAVTAGHCFLLPTELKPQQCQGKEFIAKKGNDKYKVSCKMLSTGDLKIWMVGNSTEWYLQVGATNVNNGFGHITEGHRIGIEYFIRHKHGYDLITSGLGGYDIGIIKLKYNENTPTQYKNLQTVCLPGPNFQDTIFRTKLAGYGKYYRSKCETSSRGPMKSHFCETPNTCRESVTEKNCKTEFNVPLMTPMKGCQKDAKSPAVYSRLCSKVTRLYGIAFKSDTDEIHLFQFPHGQDVSKGKFLETCYRTEDEIHGWCRTEGNYYDLSAVKSNVEIKSDYGWGFCSPECDQDTKQKSKGVLRKILDADVLEDDVCNKIYQRYISKLKSELKKTNRQEKLMVIPEVLCVGRIHPLKYQAYYVQGDAMSNTSAWGELPQQFFDVNPQILKEIYKSKGIDIEGKGYYASAIGSCNGDSGGPAFQDGNLNGLKRFVMTGIVSGGRSQIFGGTCGGINNPTVYTRVRGVLTDWILKAIQVTKDADDTDKVCISDQVFNYEKTKTDLNSYFKLNKISINLP